MLFQCAKYAGADFKEDKTLYCIKHAQRYGYKENVSSWVLGRGVWVDREGIRKTKMANCRTLSFSLGSLLVESLGTLVPASQRGSVSSLI